MQTEYKYIHFVKVDQKARTSVWSCRNNNTREELGVVKWHKGWRQYAFFNHGETMWSVGCFNDICSFIIELRRTERNEV